ncbi:hypothetical protein M758_3G096500 [Ceratodon purpureus]|nr:hypothetical protein M758_3G096500 [Ceratodon purpureus]
MAAVCSQLATVRVVNCSLAGSRTLNLVRTNSLECSLGGALVRETLTCKPKEFSSKRLNKIKRGGRLWSPDFRSEAAAGFEDSISDKTNADVVVRKSRDAIATGSHRGNLNAYSAVEDADNAEKGNVDTVNEVCCGPNCDGSCAVKKSVESASRNGSTNGNVLKRATRNDSTIGHAYSAISPLNGSATVGNGNGPSLYADKEGVIDLAQSIDAIRYRNSRAANGVSMNGVVNGYSKAPPADGASSVLPELERLVQTPMNVPLKQSEGMDTLMELIHKLENPGVAFTTTLTPLRTHRATAVSDEVVLRNADKQQSSDADSSDGLGILKFLKGKNLLVTGATGFLAKVMVEKILRVQPDVGQLYLLIQPQKNATAEERLKNNVIMSPLFKVLKATHGENYEDFMTRKLTAVSGTISSDGLGISNEMTEEISRNVDVIVNSAATTTFDERYDTALNINTQGPRRILDFANGCPNLQLFLHVSTAFVNGQRQGHTPEKLFKMGDSIAREMSKDGNVPELDVASEMELCANTLKKVAAEMDQTSIPFEEQQQILEKKMKELGMARAKLFGWQDTYVFSKAMGEMLVDSLRGDIPVVILRPSVVESTFADPFPGWMEGIRMMDPIVLAYGKGQMTGFLANPQGVLDVIPADFVVNALLASMAKNAQKPGLQVYQVASSVVNPMTFNILADVALELFTKDPMVDRSGKPIKVRRMLFVQSMVAFNLYMWFVYQLPLLLSKILPWIKKGKSTSRRELIIQKTLEQFKYLAYIYKPYTFYAGRFGIENTETLSKELSTEELETFAFNVRQLDWADYLYNVHIPGLRNYVLKGRGTRT